jgi:hypothetical protein
MNSPTELLLTAEALLTEEIRQGITAAEFDAEAMESAVCTITRVMRGTGAPPEKVIIRIKEISSRAGAQAPGNAQFPSTNVEKLLVTIVTTCVETYYEDATSVIPRVTNRS